jgi:hypothetical protein
LGLIVRFLLQVGAILAAFIPYGALARGGFIPYCGSVCRYEQSNLLVGIIGGVVLTGAILVALFHGAVAAMILKGDAKEGSSLGESAMIMAVSLLVVAGSIIFTGGGALIGLFFIALYFGGCMLFGKRRY